MGLPRSKPCSCGCNSKVKRSRVKTGKSWHVQVNSKWMFFAKTSCLVAAARAQPSWSSDIASALRAHVNKEHGHGVVQGALQEVETVSGALLAAGPEFVPAGPATSKWRDDMMERYMTLFVLGLVEFWRRMGFQFAKAWKVKMLKAYPCRDAFQNTKHNTFWALLDTTSLFCLKAYVRKRRRNGPQMLLSIVGLLVMWNSKAQMDEIWGSDGIPLGITALGVMERHHAARQRNPSLPQYPVGGLTGSGRIGLDLFARSLGLMAQTGRNSDAFHFFVGALFVERAASVASATWSRLQDVMALETPHERNAATEDVVSDAFYMKGLIRQQMCRYLGEAVPQMYDASISNFVGERSAMGLRSLLQGSGEFPQLTDPVYQQHLGNLADYAGEHWKNTASQHLGKKAADWLEANIPPGLGSFKNRLLHEHNTCDHVKMENPGNRKHKGARGEPTPDKMYQDLVYGAFPRHKWPAKYTSK